jgi:transposase
VEVGPDALARFFEVVLPHLNERQRRMVVGAAVGMCGPGTKSMVAEAAGTSRNTVIKAVSEVEAGIQPSDRVRAPGAGVKPITETRPELLAALDELVHPETRGNPMSLLGWTSKSTANLAQDLVRQGFTVSDDTVGRLLKRLGFSLRAPSKSKELTKHPDRNGQFEYLNATATAFVADGQPVISVDTKKKELVGEYANGGVEYQPAGHPVAVLDHDFISPETGKVIPYGVYDLITTDAGGSNGHRVRAWKVELAKLAADIGLEITVIHYPPGTSKWNKIEHRMFSVVSMPWRGRPLNSYRTIVELISATTTETGLTIRAELDTDFYPKGVVVTDKDLDALPLTRHEWHGDWNYTLQPPAIAQSTQR